MFTGLIEAIGTIHHIAKQGSGCRITVVYPETISSLSLGDSIALDGVCTTVVALENNTFSIEASAETLSKTLFGQYKVGTHVNLERPLLPTSRLGGHFVTGHVDGLATLAAIESVGLAQNLTLVISPEFAPYFISKGSVTLAGISLTVNWIKENQFGVTIIPHTWDMTTLSERCVGDQVHLETDILGKYLYRFWTLQPHNEAAPPSLTAAFLAQHGYIQPQQENTYARV